MLRQQIALRFCRNGLNGPLLHVQGTVSDATCGQKSSSRTARTTLRSPFVLILALFLVASVSLGSTASANQANAFVYHRFDDSRYPSTNISMQDFRTHLELIQEKGFKVLTLGEIVRRLKSGIELPERCAAITVDDAYRTFLTNGWPLLKEYGFPATLFVSTDSVGGGDYLDWQELQRLAAEGVEIGNHSAGHAYLLDHYNQAGWVQWVKDDLERSQHAFRENLGASPSLFAYPYGEYSPELVELVKQAGFVAAFGQQSGVISAGQDLFTLPRFPMGAGFVSLDSFRSKLFIKHLPVETVDPKSPVLKSENPPRLKFYLNSEEVSKATLNCYIPGQKECRVEVVDDAAGLYKVQAEQPIKERRSKYTVTASDSRGQTWFWFSQLWVLPEVGPMTDNPVSR